MNVIAECNGCKKQFTPPHFNSRCCSVLCKKISRTLSRNYRSKPTAKKLAVIRSTRCLKNSPYLQEEKKKRDSAFAKTERGREINKKSVKLYLATEKGKICRKNGKHRRRQLEKTGRITAKEWALKLKQYQYKCVYCESDENIEMDHIIPLSKGGDHNINNIQPLCRSCNAKKGNKILWAI